MIPDPHTPVTRVPPPITPSSGSSVSGSMRTRSIAPAVARCPQLIWAPSNAGPVGLDAANSRWRSPSTISALVPTSTRSCVVVAMVRALGEDRGGRVGADVAGDARSGVEAGERQVEIEVGGRVR